MTPRPAPHPFAPWALAFTVLPWKESAKAAAWARLEAGEDLPLPDEVRVLWEGRDAFEPRGCAMLLPGEPDCDRLCRDLPYPVALWVKGTVPPPSPVVAIVGSRKASPAGLGAARDLAEALTAAGVAVISGLARGIDAAAHEGALEVGATWGVLGSGLLQPYPPEHRPLIARMVKAGGGVLSCFPPEAPPRPWHFPRRNVLLASWAQAVVVVEADLKSGSLVTAKLALDRGKEVWVRPGSPGCDELLKEEAAHPWTTATALLEDLAGTRGT
jgi:DNA processing protein